MNTPSITEMLKALLGGGMTQQAIAKEIGVTQPTIFRALNGAELRYGSGKELEKLYLARIASADSRGPESGDLRRGERRKADRRRA